MLSFHTQRAGSQIPNGGGIQTGFSMHTLLPWGWGCCIFVYTVYERVQSKWGLQLNYRITKYTAAEKKLYRNKLKVKNTFSRVLPGNSTMFSHHYDMKITRINRNNFLFLPDSYPPCTGYRE